MTTVPSSDAASPRDAVPPARDDVARLGPVAGAVRGPELSPPAPYEPEVWVREDPPSAKAPSSRKRSQPAPIDTELVRSELAGSCRRPRPSGCPTGSREAARAFANEQLDDARRILKPDRRSGTRGGVGAGAARA